MHREQAGNKQNQNTSPPSTTAMSKLRIGLMLVYLSLGGLFVRGASPPSSVSTVFGTSYQVNLDANGQNIVGDAANEPSLCLDPNHPDHIAIGWRQFNSVSSDFRQAGWG